MKEINKLKEIEKKSKSEYLLMKTNMILGCVFLLLLFIYEILGYVFITFGILSICFFIIALFGSIDQKYWNLKYFIIKRGKK